MRINHNNFLKLAFNIAKLNLGKTRSNPSVGCVVVKNNSVISSGYTSTNGRPHAEFNALNNKKNYKNSDLYVTLEPCTHYGLTPPCTDIIIKKGIKRVFYSFDDKDVRTANKLRLSLKKRNIKIYKIKTTHFRDFYKSYFLIHTKRNLYIDAKIAISNDYFTIRKNRSKWITNSFSRNRTHLIRSEYDAVISTSKSINEDNSMLNCRLDGFNSKKPDLIIVDMNLKIKTKLNLFKNIGKRNILIVTSVKNDKKIFHLQKKGVKIILINHLKTKNDFENLFVILKMNHYNRILVESGLIFLNQLIKNKLIYNLFLFKSPFSLNKEGKNNISNKFIKKLKLKNKIKVNLNGDKLYKIKLK